MISETPKNDLVVRSLKTGAVTLALVTLSLEAMHRSGWAVGFLCGSALSLFSLWTLHTVVRFLFRPGGLPYKSALLGVTLFIKLPIYCLFLDVALNAKGITQNALCVGLALVPIVITLKTLGQALMQNVPASNPQHTTLNEATAEPARRAVSRRKAARVVRERG